MRQCSGVEASLPLYSAPMILIQARSLSSGSTRMSTYAPIELMPSGPGLWTFLKRGSICRGRIITTVKQTLSMYMKVLIRKLSGNPTGSEHRLLNKKKEGDKMVWKKIIKVRSDGT